MMMFAGRPRSVRSLALLLAGTLAAAPGCQIPSVPLWGVHISNTSSGVEVDRTRNIAYYDGPDADAIRHRLDLYLPRGQRDFPVVVLVHGGAWTSGDNRQYGLFSAVAEFLAEQGLGVVVPNYRLSPAVEHPEHVKDVARAVAWTHRHIGEYGGDRDRLFLIGHSAGGHLVSLLTTDDRYLREEGLSSGNIKGVVSVSGVYHLSPSFQQVVMGGSFRLDQLLPVRNETAWNWRAISSIPTVGFRLDAYSPAFGDDPIQREEASPVRHVRPGLPPFLLLSAEKDLPTLPEGASEFRQELLAKGNEAQLYRATKRNHHSIMFRAITPEDPVAKLILRFIRGQAAKR